MPLCPDEPAAWLTVLGGFTKAGTATPARPTMPAWFNALPASEVSTMTPAMNGEKEQKKQAT